MAVDIRFLGQSCFELKAGGATVLTDPFLTGNPLAAASAEEVEADAILAHFQPFLTRQRDQAVAGDAGKDRAGQRRGDDAAVAGQGDALLHGHATRNEPLVLVGDKGVGEELVPPERLERMLQDETS